MAGNKALEKFKKSKIPKKGTSTTTAEVPIYQEPNTHSKIIGTIKKDEMVNWISKSICEEKEWIRCDKKNNFGYIISGELDGTCNLNLNLIQEKKEEKIENNNLDNESQLNQEESEYAQEALNEILEEEDKKAESNSENDYSNSTGFGNDSNNYDVYNKEEKDNNSIFEVKNDEIFNENEVVFEPKEDNIFNEENLHNLYFDADISNLDRLKKEYNKLSKDFESMLEQDQNEKLNISQALESISDILPENNKLFETKDSRHNDLDSKREEKLRQYLKEVRDRYNILKNVNSYVDNIAKVMKEVNGNFRITDGDNFSPKYYANGWKWGSKARIKTYNIAEISEKIRNITGRIGNVTKHIDRISNGVEFIKALKEDGYKVGEKTLTKGGEISGTWAGTKAGAWAGAKLGAKIGSFIPANPLVTKLFGFVAGGIIGGIVGGFLGSIGGEKGGEFIADMIKEKKDDKEEEKLDGKKDEMQD